MLLLFCFLQDLTTLIGDCFGSHHFWLGRVFLPTSPAKQYDSISEITPENETWTIVAKVIRLWKVSHFSKPNVPFSMEMVLMDDKGDKIHAYVRRTLIYKFDKDLIEDVMGMLTGVGTEREYEKNGVKTKINAIAVDADGHKIECALFGPYVDELNAFMASGEVQNAVVIFQMAKVKSFQGKIHLQNCMNYTKIIYNAVSQEAITLRNRMNKMLESPTQGLIQLTETGTVGLENDFLQVTPRKTIEGLKECKEESSYVVYATFKHVIDDEDWWYTTCMYSKAVYPDHKMFFLKNVIGMSSRLSQGIVLKFV